MGSEIDDLRSDVVGEFTNLRREFGLVEEDEDDEPEPDDRVTPPAPASEEPPSSAIPVVEITPEEDDEDDRYPGSRHVRRGVQESVEETEEEEPIDWDRSPRTYLVEGQQVEFFTISALAEALRRKTVTIRKWESKGYLPTSRYRSPSGVKPSKTGKKKQDRLYTRKQIEGIVAIAEDEGLMSPEKKMRIDQTKFPERVRRLFAALERRG